MLLELLLPVPVVEDEGLAERDAETDGGSERDGADDALPAAVALDAFETDTEAESEAPIEPVRAAVALPNSAVAEPLPLSLLRFEGRVLTVAQPLTLESEEAAVVAVVLGEGTADAEGCVEAVRGAARVMQAVEVAVGAIGVRVVLMLGEGVAEGVRASVCRALSVPKNSSDCVGGADTNVVGEPGSAEAVNNRDAIGEPVKGALAVAQGVLAAQAVAGAEDSTEEDAVALPIAEREAESQALSAAEDEDVIVGDRDAVGIAVGLSDSVAAEPVGVTVPAPVLLGGAVPLAPLPLAAADAHAEPLLCPVPNPPNVALPESLPTLDHDAPFDATAELLTVSLDGPVMVPPAVPVAHIDAAAVPVLKADTKAEELSCAESVERTLCTADPEGAPETVDRGVAPVEPLDTDKAEATGVSVGAALGGSGAVAQDEALGAPVAHPVPDPLCVCIGESLRAPVAVLLPLPVTVAQPLPLELARHEGTPESQLLLLTLAETVRSPLPLPWLLAEVVPPMVTVAPLAAKETVDTTVLLPAGLTALLLLLKALSVPPPPLSVREGEGDALPLATPDPLQQGEAPVELLGTGLKLPPPEALAHGVPRIDAEEAAEPPDVTVAKPLPSAEAQAVPIPEWGAVLDGVAPLLPLPTALTLGAAALEDGVSEGTVRAEVEAAGDNEELLIDEGVREDRAVTEASLDKLAASDAERVGTEGRALSVPTALVPLIPPLLQGWAEGERRDVRDTPALPEAVPSPTMDALGAAEALPSAVTLPVPKGPELLGSGESVDEKHAVAVRETAGEAEALALLDCEALAGADLLTDDVAETSALDDRESCDALPL